MTTVQVGEYMGWNDNAISSTRLVRRSWSVNKPGDLFLGIPCVASFRTLV